MHIINYPGTSQHNHVLIKIRKIENESYMCVCVSLSLLERLALTRVWSKVAMHLQNSFMSRSATVAISQPATALIMGSRVYLLMCIPLSGAWVISSRLKVIHWLKPPNSFIHISNWHEFIIDVTLQLLFIRFAGYSNKKNPMTWTNFLMQYDNYFF